MIARIFRKAVPLTGKGSRGWSMSDLGQARRSTLLDAAWRTAYRVGFPLARIWWRLRHQQHEGALVAVYVGQALLLVRSSYRIEWNFPGGTVRHGEALALSARRFRRYQTRTASTILVSLDAGWRVIVIKGAAGSTSARADRKKDIHQGDRLRERAV